MLLPGWGLIAICSSIGIAGLIVAYRKPWGSVFAFIAVVCVTAATILKLRDPLSLTIETRRYAETWDYIAALFWAFVIGIVLPLIGLYLRSRSSDRKPKQN
jgi:hypothetical protein